MKADPQKSVGAQLERKAFRAYLRRKRDRSPALLGIPGLIDVNDALRWIDKRRARYDAAPGGLGRK